MTINVRLILLREIKPLIYLVIGFGKVSKEKVTNLVVSFIISCICTFIPNKKGIKKDFKQIHT